MSRTTRSTALRRSLPLAFVTICALGFATSLLGSKSLPGATQPARSHDLVSNDGTYRVSYSSEPETIPWGERFALVVRAERTDGTAITESLEVDARMPEHGHGMNREPVVERLENGSFRITNLLFHMPGYWEIYFDFTRGAITERAQFSTEID